MSMKSRDGYKVGDSPSSGSAFVFITCFSPPIADPHHIHPLALLAVVQLPAPGVVLEFQCSLLFRGKPTCVMVCPPSICTDQ